MTRPVRALSMLAALAAGLAVAIAPTSASATTSISGVKVTSISHNGFAVALNSLGSGWTYHLYASTTKSNVYASNLSKATYKAAATKPAISMGSMKYTTAVYWWRIQATKGSSHHTSSIYSLGLRPSNVSSVAAKAAKSQLTTVTWASGAATDFNIQTATDAAYTQNVVTYTLHANGRSYTPYRINNGTAYYYRVRALNHGVASSWIPAAGNPVATLASHVSVKVMTYNILTNLMDGQKEGSYTVASWSNARRDGAAKLILNAAPDLIAIQEGSAWVGSPQGRGGTRMVDSLVSALGGHYGLATTEIPPSQPNYYRTGDYILYNKSTFKSIGDSTSNHWTIGTPGGKAWFGVYDTLQQLSTGARIFFVGTHLATGSGSTADTERENETKALISDATNADKSGYPIVYAGDMNSHPYPGHVDGPGVAMSQAGIPDAEAEAQAFTNHQYNSANQYLNPPPATQDNIDHVFVPSGSGVSSWKLVLDLVSGKLRTPIPSDHNPLVATIQLPY